MNTSELNEQATAEDLILALTLTGTIKARGQPSRHSKHGYFRSGNNKTFPQQHDPKGTDR